MKYPEEEAVKNLHFRDEGQGKREELDMTVGSTRVGGNTEIDGK